MITDLEELIETFGFFDDWEDKYRFVIDLGKELPDMDSALKTDDHLVRGCQSKVWLVHTFKENKIQLQMDSDAFIVRGLIAIVLSAMNNKTAEEIRTYDIFGLFDQLELMSHLSSTRGNGLRAMIEKIQTIANT